LFFFDSHFLLSHLEEKRGKLVSNLPILEPSDPWLGRGNPTF
jgi:hypothetical protein